MSEERGRSETLGTIREYLYEEQLAERTPWSKQAIKAMVKQGAFKVGMHYFRPGGPGARLIFKWSAIVDFIEGVASPPSGRR